MSPTTKYKHWHLRQCIDFRIQPDRFFFNGKFFQQKHFMLVQQQQLLKSFIKTN